ncbi:hypothetical protein ACGFJC_02555 [Nonomuraea fuscirosea]|uniref:hypothetical protein n=1 Tax=Nonomuraea fuscirosea TaxID=1291556 RepID=UPI003472C9E3
MRTPRFVAFDDTCSVVDVPYGDVVYGDVLYMVLGQEHDDDLARLDLSVDRAVGVLHQMGRELVRLHRARGTAEPELTAVPVQDSAVDGRALTEAACWLTAGPAAWRSNSPLARPSSWCTAPTRRRTCSSLPGNVLSQQVVLQAVRSLGGTASDDLP